MAKLFVSAIVFAAIFGATRAPRAQDVSTPAAPAPANDAIVSDLQGRWKLQTAQAALDDELGNSIQEKLAALTLVVQPRCD